MLDRQVVKEFLKEKLKGVEIPKDISFEVLVEGFCQYIENDYHEWLKDNLKSFFEFQNGELNWSWIREKINYLEAKLRGIPSGQVCFSASSSQQAARYSHEK